MIYALIELIKATLFPAPFRIVEIFKIYALNVIANVYYLVAIALARCTMQQRRQIESNMHYALLCIHYSNQTLDV